MNRCINIIPYQTLRKKDRILVVVAFPGHKSDQRVLTKSDLTIAGRRTICNNFTSFYVIILINNRLLVVAVALVASLKFSQMVYITVSIGISLDDDLIGSGTLNYTCILCNNTNAGVNSSLTFNTGTYYRSLCA